MIDQTLLAADLEAWRARWMSDVNRELPAIVTSTPGDDPAVDQFVRNTAAAVLTAPLALDALNAAVPSIVTKEYV